MAQSLSGPLSAGCLRRSKLAVHEQEYRKYVRINSIVAIALAIILVVIAYKAQDDVAEGYEWTTVVMFALALLPAPLTLGALWIDANRQVKPMKEDADDLEKRALAS
jgi:Na+/proline symporter